MIKQFGKNIHERIDNAVTALQQGRGLILVDDEDRENEGDIIFPAETITSENMALMIRECSGIVCLCLTPERCSHLDLPQMVEENSSRNGTAFTVSIEARHGVTTGVSARDRVQTIKTAVNADAVANDLARPGHVFPLAAKDGGVLSRRGHTEGSIDIVKIAGMGSSAVLSEITNPDGTMARLPELCEFAKQENMTILSIDDIVKYREEKEQV